jgi:hypothetical protein
MNRVHLGRDPFLAFKSRRATVSYPSRPVRGDQVLTVLDEAIVVTLSLATSIIVGSIRSEVLLYSENGLSYAWHRKF